MVVDEAYFHFSGQTFLPLLGRHENLVILRTLSKVGFAAMRIGLLIGPPALVHELDKVRLPYNLNAMSQAAAAFYLDHEETFLKQAEEIRRWRGELFAAMKTIPGIRPRPTDANFIFFDCDFDADRVYSEAHGAGNPDQELQRPRDDEKLHARHGGNPRRKQQVYRGVAGHYHRSKERGPHIGDNQG